MACHGEVLDAARIITTQKGVNEFTLQGVVSFLKKKGADYKTNTIRTHVTSRCCKNAPANHAVVYNYFLRIRYGTYKVIV